MNEQELNKVRSIRTKKNARIPPSPYLKERYVDEYGEESPVQVREYQKTGIMNLCVVPRTVLGDATGIGKTLQMLSAIGYVWLEEPEYVPIIVTKKSALYQWDAEVQKFMKNMMAITVDGPPVKRQKAYAEFFLNYDQMSKRLLIITYDMLLKDADEAVVRDMSRKPNKKEKEKLAELRSDVVQSKKDYEEELRDFDKYFDERPYEVWDHAKSLAAVGSGPETKTERPTTWSAKDERRLQVLLMIRDWHLDDVRAHEEFRAEVCPTMIIPGLLQYVEELKASHPDVKFMLIMDEAHTLKNHKGKMHGNAARVAAECGRVYGLTATPVKNRLMEFFALFKIVVPSLFPKITPFQDAFCVTKLQPIGGGRKVRIVVGYKNLQQFVSQIEPYYLARQKHEVAHELPSLITRELRCELSDMQEELYDLAEAGLLEKNADPDADSAAVLGAMTHVQEAVDSPELLEDDEGNPFEGDSTKLQVLLDMFENELDGVKTIVFSRFRRVVDIIEREMVARKMKCVRITGAENKASVREKAKRIFQDPKSGVNVILITTAGSESINLQTAEHFVLFDAPWSYGDYVQLLGRMIRIGSKHQTTVATHLVAVRQNGEKTIDHYVIKKLREKKKLADRVAGEGLKDGLMFVKDDPMELVGMIESGRGKGQKTPKKALVSRSAPKEPQAKEKPRKAKEKPRKAKAAKPEVPDVSDVSDAVRTCTIPVIDPFDL